MQVGDWRWSGDNPIERAAIGVHFAVPFTPAVIGEASARYPKFRKRFPRRMNQQAMMMQVGQQGGAFPMPMPLMQSPQPAGFMFDRSGPDGRQDEGFNLSGNAVAYSCSSYTRWRDVWPRADVLFSEMIPIITDSGNLAAAVTLEYVNKFVWSDEPASADISALLTDGPFVCANVFRLSGLWHSFHGFFRDADKPVPGSHLENINLTLSDRPDPLDGTEMPRRCLDVVVSHRFTFQNPTTFTYVGQDEERLTLLEDCATSMHERNKGILRELLLEVTVGHIPGLGVSR